MQIEYILISQGKCFQSLHSVQNALKINLKDIKNKRENSLYIENHKISKKK